MYVDKDTRRLAGVIIATAVACASCSKVPSHFNVEPEKEARIQLRASNVDNRCRSFPRTVVYSGDEPKRVEVWNPDELPRSEGGVIYNDKIARRIAEDYLTAMFGNRMVEVTHPLKIQLHSGVWYVKGTIPEGWAGGTLYIQLCQSSGAVLNYYGTQ